MKKNSYLFFIIIILFAIIGIFLYNEYSENTEENDTSDENIIVSVSTEIITTETEEIEFTITNNGHSDFSYGMWFYVQQKADESWKDVEFIGDGVIEILNRLSAGQSCSHILPLREWYGTLKAGQYRIGIGTSTDKLFYGNFTIKDVTN